MSARSRGPEVTDEMAKEWVDLNFDRHPDGSLTFPKKETTAYPSQEDAGASYRRSVPEPKVPTSDNQRSDCDDSTTAAPPSKKVGP